MTAPGGVWQPLARVVSSPVAIANDVGGSARVQSPAYPVQMSLIPPIAVLTQTAGLEVPVAGEVVVVDSMTTDAPGAVAPNPMLFPSRRAALGSIPTNRIALSGPPRGQLAHQAKAPAPQK